MLPWPVALGAAGRFDSRLVGRKRRGVPHRLAKL
jgi:hypothetical protein